MSLRLITNNQNGGPPPALRRLASLVVFLLFNDLAFYFGGRSLTSLLGKVTANGRVGRLLHILSLLISSANVCIGWLFARHCGAVQS
jgi:hypothetical protein